jgi:hypothetical protein
MRSIYGYAKNTKELGKRNEDGICMASVACAFPHYVVNHWWPSASTRLVETSMVRQD